MNIPDSINKQLLTFQKNEITEYYIYKKLAKIVSPDNAEILNKIAEEELGHYKDWKKYTNQDVKPDKRKIRFFYIISRVFGFTFAIKLMENGEGVAQNNYNSICETISEAADIAIDESDHENALIQLLDEERLRYTGSIVLGLNDALVELTGALAGLTLALQNTKLIALTGSITGIAAALSMGASEYLSTKSEETSKSPLKASLYTGAAYIVTVLALIAPYLVLKNYYACLACTLATAVIIIGLFNYYISVAKDVPFKKRFFEMCTLSFGIAGISFFIGYLIRVFIGVDV